MKIADKVAGALLFGFIMLICSQMASAAVTSFWEVGGVEESLQGEFQSTGVTSEGEIIPTWSFRSFPLTARVLWGVAVEEELALVGTSGPAALYRIKDNNSADTAVKELLRSDQLGFTALAQSGGELYAAEMPSGRIYRYDRGRDTAVVAATLPDSHIFTMIADEDNEGLYIGSGPNGAVYHLSGGGKVEKLGAIKNRNILSLVIHRGDIYAGDDLGGLFRVSEGEKPEAVYSFPEAEINALASDQKYLYLGVNRTGEVSRRPGEDDQNVELARLLEEKMLQKGVEQTGEPQPPDFPDGEAIEADTPPQKRSASEQFRKVLQEQERQAQVAEMFTGRIGSAVVKMKPGEELNVLYSRAEGSINDLAHAGDDLLVATGEPGRVFKLGSDGVQVVYVQPGQEQVTGLNVNGRLQALTTARGGRIYLRREYIPEETTYRSQPFDAGLLSKWGRVQSFFSGDIEFRVRSGLTDSPDTYWTDWSVWKGEKSFESAVKPARYFQFEARFLEEDARLRKFEVAYRSPNQRPQIIQFTVTPQNLRDKILRGEPDEQNHGGLPREVMRALTEIPREREFSWQALAPDGDRLQAALYYRPEGTARWIPMPEGQNLLDNKFSWRDEQFPDGYYEIKLTIDDKLVNPPQESFSISRTIGPLLVDNTPPEINNLRASDGQLKFKAVDRASRMILAQYRINGESWQRMRPVDGLFDSREERFSSPLSAEVSGDDLVEIVVIDEGGNSAGGSVVIP